MGGGIYRSKTGLGKAVFTRYKRNALKRNILWELPLEEFILITARDCSYCGGKPASSGLRWNGSSHLTGREDFIFNGIDRVDNTKGYIKGNVVACCSKCNYVKGQLSQEDLLWQISAMVPRLVSLLSKKYPFPKSGESTESSEPTSKSEDPNTP